MFEVFNPMTGETVATVATEAEARRLAHYAPELDYDNKRAVPIMVPVATSPCYCDSAYHPQGH